MEEIDRWTLFDGAALKVGDRVTLDEPIYRRWWEFWKPHIVGKRRRTYTIIDSNASSKPPMFNYFPGMRTPPPPA
jgi:hypothetical protein